MKYEIIPLFTGFPARSSRGYLGWSSVYLIQIKEASFKKNLLFDTAGYNERETLLQVLSEHSLRPEDINGIVLSHLHFDHAVNWTLFPKADIYIHEFELASSIENEDYAVPDFHRERLREYPNLHLVSEHDLIEGMEVIHLPGHTRGLIGLKIESKFLVSDAIKNRQELNGGPLMNTWNKEIAKESILKVSRNAEIIYPGHDVPLIKKGNQWIGLTDAEEKITITEGLHNKDGNNEILMKILSE